MSFVYSQESYAELAKLLTSERLTAYLITSQGDTGRNRVAHHEPIFKKDQMREYAKILEAIRWICPYTAAWVDSSIDYRAA